jgi:hypothetical protein
MLTGHVPFDGESAGEILMKHLTSPPDLTKLPGDYVTIVGKALAKNPAHRYASMAEMAKTVETVGKPLPAAPKVAAPQPAPAPAAPKRVLRPDPVVLPVAQPVVSIRGQIAELCGSLAMSAVLAAVVTTLWAALGQGEFKENEIGQVFFLTVATCWAVLVPAKLWTHHRGDAWSRRIIMMVLGLAIGFGSLWLEGWVPKGPAVEFTSNSQSAETGTLAPIRTAGREFQVAGHLAYFALAFFALRWWKLADRRRAHRFSFAPVIAAAFWGVVLLPILWEPWATTWVLTVAAGIVQLVSPWEQPPPPVARRMRLRYA